MLALEKAEQIFIHASPEKCRWLASRLEAIAAQVEKTGNAHDHLMTEERGGSELTNELTNELIGNPSL
ncbi:hypothetical protein [Pseudoalteromonas sp. PS5]|uniref:Imm32 family immunity protein n=1 Tax=Pseudoalteromonas sp. PS5 TaxID=1437473 RepID=UPI000FFE98A4|nr:hypothetical protein [Pseudoalteromonas sp. PS5]RXE98082.1 hypothetical protein D9603_17475 [Pseudoalteromonas sp. PS5]